ncbi:MAG: thioredoxin family protein [Polaromonas sp.]|nr:thioredoxin family protein [Polaromonas sp.]
MQIIATKSQLEPLKAGPALLVLFGGAHCGVCQVIKPRIESVMAQHFPEIALAYVDCEETPDICAQHGVFTLPVVKLLIEGQVCLEMARSFSLQELTLQVDRIYRLWQESKN